MRNGFCPDCDFQNSVNNFFDFFIRAEFGLSHFGVDVCFCNIKLQFVYMKDGFVKLRVLGAVLAVILGEFLLMLPMQARYLQSMRLG